MPYLRKRPLPDPCPVEHVISLVGGKWKARIVLLTSLEPCGFATLRRALPGITQQVLSTQLQGLVSDGLVSRSPDRADGDVVLYRLTAAGESLLPVLDAVAAWGNERLRETGQIWERPGAVDRRPGSAPERRGA